jgi:hypothetical protein
MHGIVCRSQRDDNTHLEVWSRFGKPLGKLSKPTD